MVQYALRLSGSTYRTPMKKNDMARYTIKLLPGKKNVQQYEACCHAARGIYTGIFPCIALRAVLREAGAVIFTFSRPRVTPHEDNDLDHLDHL